jgi:hypothetical protein
MKPSVWGYNWVTLFLEDINMGTWSSRLGESRIWDAKILWVPHDLDLRMTALVRPSSKRKLQTHPVREGAPHQETSNSLTVIKIWSWATDGCQTPRQTGRLSIGFNITLTWILLSPAWGRSNSSTVALRVIRGNEKGTRFLGFKLGYLVLGG